MGEIRVSIGDFARAARLTVKALRHYHAEGLLEPAWIDPSSNYRYYSWDQLSDTLRITTLRELGVPIPVVRDHLRGGLALTDVISAERTRLEREIAQARRALELIDQLGTSSRWPDYELDVVDQVGLSTWALSKVIPADGLGEEAASLIGELLDSARRRGIDTEPAVWGEYPVVLQDSISITVHLPVGATVAADQPPDDVVLGRIASGPLLRLVHRGPLATLPLGYRALLTHIEAKGHRPNGPVYERYLTDPSVTPADQNQVEILHPWPSAWQQ